MAPRPYEGADSDLDKKANKYLRLSWALGVCCFALLTANLVLLRVAWPCLVSSSEANRRSCPPASAESTPSFVESIGAIPATPEQFQVGLDKFDSLQPAEDKDSFARRTSAASSQIGSSSGSSSGKEEGSHHGHAHDAMLFLFNAIIIGVLVLHLTTHPKLHFIQHTSTLFVLGMVYALIQEGLKLNAKLGVLGRSYGMWMDIDPHLILFTLLPALLAGDAMAIDTSVVKRVASQCIYLAGPGVLVGSLCTAGFIMLYLGWSFKLSLTMGAILAATDPVAVVSLLKQLGASPTLTVQIAGESLLNDGTAIVLYTMAYEMLHGKTYGPTETIIFIVRKAFCALGLGWVIGWVFVIWIQVASNRFEHHSSTIQISLTLCCAYWSFIMAEGVLDMSGVLCTVAASLVLADKMWVSIVEKESMTHVWHIFDFLGNSLIFFLAGALTGDCMVHIPWVDYLHLLALYAVSMIIRALIIFLSRPILQYLNPDRTPVSRAEALIMTVGGLRGAVGLALAIQVSANKEGAIEDEMDARRVLFYTGGIATLTLVVNASLCPKLVRALGLVNTDDTKKQMLLKLHSQMLGKASTMIHSSHVGIVLNEMMTEVKRQIDVKYATRGEVTQANVLLQHARTSESLWLDEFSPQVGNLTMVNNMNQRTTTARPSFFARASEWGNQTHAGHSVRRSISHATTHLARMFTMHGLEMDDGDELASNYHESKVLFETVHKKFRKQLNLLDLPEAYELQEEAAMLHIVRSSIADDDMMRATTVVFLSLVKAQYWHQIHNGEFIEGSSHPEVLLRSVLVGSDAKKLADFDFILQELGLTETNLKEEMEFMVNRRGANSSKSSVTSIGTPPPTGPVLKRARPDIQEVIQVSREVAHKSLGQQKEHQCHKQVVQSTAFNGFITSVVLANVLVVFIEEGYKQDDSDDYSIWLVVESCFNLIFLVEFVLKFSALRCSYFKSGWNVFDFFLIIVGIAGIILEIVWLQSDEKKKMVLGADTNLSQEARVFRLNRVFRVMRLVRVFRLVKFIQIMQAKLAGNEISLELAKHLRKITVLTAYARATREAQTELFHYFGGPKQPTVEQARCLLESQTYIFQAASLALCELKKVDMTILKSLSVLRESGKIADSLSDFICEAQEVGVVSAREADNLLAPIHKRRSIWHHLLHESEMGIVRRHSFDKFASLSVPLQMSKQNTMEQVESISRPSKSPEVMHAEYPTALHSPEDLDSEILVLDAELKQERRCVDCDEVTEVQGIDFTHPHSPAESPLRTSGRPCDDSSR